jgi:DNA replication and repair protein RecF
MAITSVRLQNFRTYSDESFEFEPGVNIVVGPNASGKTNLLESILVLARGSSYRTRDAELVQFNKPWARLDGFFENYTRVVKLEERNGKIEKSFAIDDKPFKRFNLEKTLPVVLFEPNHLQFIVRGPEQRREYIDDLLERSETGFKALLANYRRVLAQRNALLKYGFKTAKKQLFVWNVRLSELGSKLAESRAGIIAEINQDISKTYSEISQKKSTVEVFYDSQFPLEAYASKLLYKLENNLHQDLERGFTAYGPHREDIIFYLNGQLVNETASRGEMRTLVLALKVYELKLIEETREQKPIFLLDDVFSELDGARRHSLVDHLKNYQTVITTTDADAVIEHFAVGHNLISVSKD